MPGPTTIENVVKLGRKNLIQAQKLYESGSLRKLAEQMAVNTIETSQQFEEMAAFAGPGLAQQVNEFGEPPTVGYQQIYNATFQPIKYMLQAEFSHEALADEQKVYSVLSGYGQDLREGFQQAEEIYAANTFMNFADDGTNYPGPDAIALGGAHVTEDGTYSNFLATPAPIAPDSFNDLLTILMRQPAYQSGMLMPYYDSVVIEVAPEQEMAALELQKSLMRPDTANTVENVRRARISDVIVNPFFTNTLRWGVHGTIARRCRRFRLNREGYNLVEFAYERANDAYVATARQRVFYGWMDWRDQAFSFS